MRSLVWITIQFGVLIGTGNFYVEKYQGCMRRKDHGRHIKMAEEEVSGEKKSASALTLAFKLPGL